MEVGQLNVLLRSFKSDFVGVYSRVCDFGDDKPTYK